MPEEKKEEEQPQETPSAAPESDGPSRPENLDAIKAELEEERKARAAVEAALAEKDTRIAELEARLGEADQNFASLDSQVAQLKEAHSQAVAKYLGVVRLANPAIPDDVIGGSTIGEIEASVQKATAIAAAVKADLEARAKEARVPAGAPARGEISIEGLSPREKIAAGIQQKGGTS